MLSTIQTSPTAKVVKRLKNFFFFARAYYSLGTRRVQFRTTLMFNQFHQNVACGVARGKFPVVVFSRFTAFVVGEA